jgi:hypothetical protein
MILEERCEKIGIIEFLKEPVTVSGEAAIRSWGERRRRFSDFVDGLTGIGWSTFDCILRDLQYPGCVMLFKLDSTNEAFIEKIFPLKVNGNRTKYLQLLAGTKIFDDYSPAVVNMAIYLFTSKSGLGYVTRLRNSDIPDEFILTTST